MYVFRQLLKSEGELAAVRNEIESLRHSSEDLEKSHKKEKSDLEVVFCISLEYLVTKIIRLCQD